MSQQTLTDLEYSDETIKSQPPEDSEPLPSADAFYDCTEGDLLWIDGAEYVIIGQRPGLFHTPLAVVSEDGDQGRLVAGVATADTNKTGNPAGPAWGRDVHADAATDSLGLNTLLCEFDQIARIDEQAYEQLHSWLPDVAHRHCPKCEERDTSTLAQFEGIPSTTASLVTAGRDALSSESFTRPELIWSIMQATGLEKTDIRRYISQNTPFRMPSGGDPMRIERQNGRGIEVRICTNSDCKHLYRYVRELPVDSTAALLTNADGEMLEPRTITGIFRAEEEDSFKFPVETTTGRNDGFWTAQEVADFVNPKLVGDDQYGTVRYDPDARLGERITWYDGPLYNPTVKVTFTRIDDQQTQKSALTDGYRASQFHQHITDW